MQNKRLPGRFAASLSSPWRSRDTSYVLLALSLIVFAKNFWLDEDAHIPFRSLAQLRAGNGAVWNMGERVQVTTSAAWYWLLAAVNLPLNHVLATAIIVTVLLFVALLALARRLYGDTPALWFLLGSFLLSKGFFDFTSSGHENILAYTVLLALYAAYHRTRPQDNKTTAQQDPETTGPHDYTPGFVVRGLVVTSSDPAPPRQLYLIAALTGLVPVVRHDLSLLCVLPFAWLLWRERHHWRRAVVLIALAGLPLLLWTLASLVYYGLPFPNTAYAKVLKHGFAANIILKMGLDYFYSNGCHDPLTMLIIAVAPVVALWKLQSWQRAFALGVVLYCLYLCKIGGDYFAGRFLSVPFLVAALLVADWLQSLKVPRAAAWTALATTAAYLWLIPATPLLTPWTYGRDINTSERGMAYLKTVYIIGTQDARAGAYSRTLAAWWRNEQRAPCSVEFGRRDGESLHRSSDKVVVRSALGMCGYYAGLKIHIVDPVGVTDPFLSRLPSVWLFTPGQFIRDTPDGYLEHLRDGVTPIRDPQLNRYYQQIEQITRSRDLFSLPRLKTIVAFNLGRYEPLLDAYRHEVAERRGLNPALRWTHKSAD
jgi:arabinofuranosyltransferase